jgi:DNA-directed RNA polymerase specialized sigma subunit
MAAVVKELQLLEQRRMAVKGYDIQIRQLDSDAESLSGRGYGSTPVRGGGNRQEERLVRWLDKKDKLVRERAGLAELVEHTEECLARLPERERAVLDAFYLSGLPRYEAVKQLEAQLYCGRSEVYRIRERALIKMAAMLGWLE